MKVCFSKKIIQPLNKISKIWGISWSPNNMKLAVACGDKKIYLFDEQGNNKEYFSTKAFQSNDYEIIQILFNPESTKLAVAQSDNIIFIYKLGLNWGEEKSISNKFKLEAKPNCMIWSKTNTNEIIFGSSDGKIRVCLLDENNTIKFLYKHLTQCISLSSSLDEKFIISGHKDSSIFIYNKDTSEVKKLINHSCVPTCLALVISSNILVAGNDSKVVVYNNVGETVQTFDYSNDDKVKEFSCYSIRNSGDAVALGNTDSIFIFLYNEIKNKWVDNFIKIENYFLVTSICWKPDRSALVIGNLINSVDLYDTYLNKKQIKEIFELSYINYNCIKITNKQTQQYMIIRPKDSSKPISVKFSFGNYFALSKKETLILGDLNQEIYSEISWKKTETDKYNLDNYFICIICNNEGLSLVEYGKNEVLFTYQTKAYTEEDINKIKDKYYEYLISNKQFEKAEMFKKPSKALQIEIESYIKKGDISKAIDLFTEKYNKENFDNNILELITTNLNQKEQFEKSGDLLEKMGQHKSALDIYLKGKCFSKAIEIAKNNNLTEINKINEEWGEYLLQQNDYENSIIHFIESGSEGRAFEVLIQANKWEKVIELVNRIPNVDKSIYIQIGKHFENESKFDLAEEYYMKAGELVHILNLYINNFKENKKENSNQIMEQIDKYKQFFEEMEKKKNLSTEKRDIFNEEEIKIITEKFNELKSILLNDKNNNQSIKKQNDNTKDEKEQNNENIFRKIMEGNIDKNELNDETIFTLVDFGKSVEEIEKILKLCKNLEQLLQFIYSKFSFILNIYKKKKKYLYIDEIIDIETNSLEKIRDFHELILQEEKENNYYFIDFEIIIEKQINYFKYRDIPNLLLLKEMIYNQKKYEQELLKLSMNIKDIIKKSVIYLINGKNLKPREIIDLILTCGFEMFENQEHELFKSINIYELNENDFLQFRKLWPLINNYNIRNSFIRIIFDKIEIFKDFGIIYKLIPINIFNLSVAGELEDKFKLLFYYTFNIKTCLNFLDDIYKTIEVFVTIDYQLNDFLEFIERNHNISTTMKSKLYLRILQDLKLNQNKALKNIALKFLIENNMINDINSINSIINVIGSNNKYLIQDFLYAVEKFVINEEDFLNPSSINKFRLYNVMYQRFYKYNNYSYFRISYNSLTNVYNKIIGLNLSHDKFIKLIEQLDKKEFKEKLIIFNLLKNQPDQNTIIYDLLNKNKKKYQNLIEKITKLENYLKTFFDNQEKNYLKEITEQKKILKGKNIGEALKKLENFVSKSDKYEKNGHLLKLINSKFFLALYSRNKSQEINLNQKDLFDKTVKDFLNLTILNNINEDLPLDNIPFKDIVIEDKKNKEDNCLNMVKNELDILNEIILKFNQIQNNNINIDNNEQDSSDFFIKEKKLIYLSYFENVKKVIDSFILLIDISNVNKTQFYEKLIKEKIEIENNNNICLRDVINYINFLRNLKGFELDITFFEKGNNSVFVEFLNLLVNNEEGIKFLMGKKIDEIRRLSEFIGESENPKIQISDIQDFINICNFFENTKALTEENTDIELIFEFQTAFIMTPSFVNSFSNYFNNFKEIKNVYEEYSDRPEVSRNKIEQILKFSIIEMNLDNKTRMINIKGTYKDISNQTKTFDYNDLQELHDRALLFCNKTFDNIVKDTVDNIEDKQKNSEIFVDIIENIGQLINYLNSLYIKGYPYSLDIILQIKNSSALCEEKEINILLEDYKRLSEDLENVQTKAYSQKSLIRLIYGHQFYDIYNYLIGKKKNIMPLLKKLSNDKIKAIPKINFKDDLDFEDSKKKFNYMIEKINDFLFQCLKNNKRQVKDLYVENLIKDDFHNKLYRGFYTWLDNMRLDINIINIYKHLTGNFPLPITVLLCTKETNEEEITSFIYRTILCEYRVLFIIINSDNLELSNAQYLLWIIESLYIKYKNKTNSTLLITFTDNNSVLKKELTKLKGHRYFVPSDYIGNNKIENNFNKNLIEVWTSDATGVGKSIQIRLEAKKNNKKYIYFPVGGVITRKNIIDRITKLDIDKKNLDKNYLHIDIYDSNEETSLIIREFLFSLLITRSYSYEEEIFYLDHGIKIAIEIPIGFYNMKDKFVLLDYFSQKKISLEKLTELIDLEDKNNINNNLTDIQLVTNILSMLENDSIENKIFDLEQSHREIPIKRCQNIIDKYFTLKQGNYYQKKAFIHILADQLRKFCFSFYLNPEVLLQNEKAKYFNNDYKITHVRKIMIENLIKLTLYFIKGPFTKIILNQQKTITQIFGEFNEKKINDIATNYLSKADEECISFKKINPSLVFFNEDIQTFSIITTSQKGEEEYEQLLRLYSSQNVHKRNIPLVDYRNLTHEQFLPEVKNILNLNSLSIEDIKEIIGSYCFTSDNFIKMILILLRIRAGIPVIMMGETGCGKTSLIKILALLLNKGENNLKIKNIHAGIKDKDIIDFIEKVNEEVNSENNNNNQNNNIEKNNIKTSSDKIWVFFDEINTCNSMGLLSEIFYNHSYYGKKLNDKLTFIAACNPYRLKPIKQSDIEENDFCLTSKDKKYSYNAKHNLVYLVNPLPHSLLTSIFDFGHLSSEDEKKYIKNIVKETLRKYGTNEEIENLFVEEIELCQNFVREHNDISSVSLRDLRRFNLLFDFFMNYLKQNKENYDENNQLVIHSMCLSLYFCYYIRLSNNKLRKEIIEKINIHLKNIISFEQVTQKEKDFLISKMKIPPGIAKNSTLKENIFSLFVCIVNKIPLIMCGKPGTSKSLSFQILYDSMKGNRSDNNFFKNYPEIIIFSYQGSKTSTSEGVQKVFNRAKQFLKKQQEKKEKNLSKNENIEKSNIPFNLNSINIYNQMNKDINENKPEIKTERINEEIKENIIPVVYFDEMGLAEESPHNPLKVIHSELEYDDREQKFGFVGISNWKLDASKMNRAIFLGVPNLEENDLQETANEIALNIDENIALKYKELFSNLVKTYWEYKNFTRTKNQSEFHGLRDFYHLIKNVMFYLADLSKEKDKEELDITEKSYQIGIKCLYRNFDGLKEPFNSYEEIKKIFDKYYPNYSPELPNVFECLKDNISDNNSRFLLLTTKSSMSIHLLEDIMHKLQKKYVFYNGSQLYEDLNQEKYNEKLLNKIQLSLENGDILVLRNMENIYPSLYNLFNQNFTTLGKKRFSRIAFANYNTYSLVHEDFRAIVLVDDKKIEEKMEDPPFLNRFEKHIFSFEYLMNEGELKLAEKIIECLDKILSFNEKDSKIDLRKQFLWYNSEEIKGLVAKKCYEYDKEKENIMKYEGDILNDIWIIISKLLSQDIMAFIIFKENEINIQIDMKTYYSQNHLYNFYELFNDSKNIFSKGKSTKLIIYTFSKLLEPIIREESPLMTIFGNLTRENIIERIVKSIKNDSDFDIIINDFYEKNERKILIFKFNENDLDKINQIKFKINSIENEKNKNRNRIYKYHEKHIIFIICLTRHKIENKNKFNENIIYDLISNIDTEYNQFFIDNLNGKKESNIIETMARAPSFYIEQIFDLKNSYLLNIFQKVFSFLTYQFNIPNVKGQKYVGEIMNKLLKNDFLLNLLKNKLINESGKTLNNFIKTIFSKGYFEKNDVEFLDIIFSAIYDKIYLLVFKFIFQAEKDHLLYPILFNYDFIKSENTFKHYIQKYIDKFDFNAVNVVERIESNQILLFMNLNLPLSKKWFYLIKIFIENNIKENYLANEDHIRLSYFEEGDIIKQMENYENKKQDIINIIKGEILRIDGLNDLINDDNNIKYFNILYQDFMIIYLNQKFNENLILGLQFLDILIQLKLNINKKDKYSFINNKKSISLENSNFNLNKILADNGVNRNIKYDVDTLSKILVFLISYKEEIYSLLEIFFIFNKYLDNFFLVLKNLITRKEIKYEINDNVPEYTREINEAFFIMYESLIKSIFTYKNYNKMEENVFYDFLEAIKKIQNDAKQIYLKLYLPSKEMYTMQILVNIFIAYDSCKKKKRIKDIKQIFTQIKDNIIFENLYIISKDYKKMEKNFNGLLTILDNLIDKKNNEKEYALLLNNLFLSRYNKALDNEYRNLFQ